MTIRKNRLLRAIVLYLPENILKEVLQKIMNVKMLIERIFVYLAGLIVLSFGTVLYTKVNLGLYPINTVANTVSKILNLNFSNLTLILYACFCIVQLIIRTCQKEFKEIPFIILQFPLGMVFTLAVAIYDKWIPEAGQYAGTFYGTVFFRTCILMVAIICIGVGIVLSVEPKLIPNPADGMAYVIADALNWNMGTVKNILDIAFVGISCIICFIFHSRFIGIGIGTILSMLLVGRVVAFTNKFVKGRYV